MRNQRKVLVTTPTVDAKSCTRCRKHKPASEFYRQNTSHDGLRSWCKVRRRHPPALGSAGQRWAAHSLTWSPDALSLCAQGRLSAEV